MSKKKKMILILIAILGILLISVTIYLNTSPQMGGRAGEYNSPNFEEGRFKNLVPTSVYSEDRSIIKSVFEYFFSRSKEAYPSSTIDNLKIDLKPFENINDVNLTWLGHSTVLINTQDLVILTDPVLRDKSLPPLSMGPKPFPYSTNYKLEDLPKVDVVLISHDHYDHLDMETVKKLKDSSFYVPLGVKSHLLKWGIDEKNIKELDWYQEDNYSDNLGLVLTPARHFSGRSLFDRNKTLWGSWVIKLRDKSLYFGGDSGYFDEFKKIGEKYGPFDIAMLDVGQYNLAWQPIHLLPEEAVQVSIDLNSKILLPIHNSKYSLSLHSWYEPLERVTKEGQKKGVVVSTPKIGETFLLGVDILQQKWWRLNIEESHTKF